MTCLPLFARPTVLVMIVTPWEYFVDFLPAILIAGALIAAITLITILLIRRFFGNKKK